MLVSNAEFLEFVEAGGYEERGRGWWSDEGWRWILYCSASSLDSSGQVRNGPGCGWTEVLGGADPLPRHAGRHPHALGPAGGGQQSGGLGLLRVEVQSGHMFLIDNRVGLLEK